MKKLLTDYCLQALISGLRDGILYVILLAWMPFTYIIPAAFWIATGLRAFRIIRLALPFIDLTNIPETLFSLLRISAVTATMYFVCTLTGQIIHGFWGRFLAILLAVLLSTFVHGLLLWVSDIVKGAPYFNHHAASYFSGSAQKLPGPAEKYLDQME